MAKLTQQQRKDIVSLAPELKQIKQILFAVEHSGDLPRGKGHLYSRYKNLGLIKMMNTKTQRGFIKFGRVVLTPKARRLLPVLGIKPRR